jgi:hypothetical protein
VSRSSRFSIAACATNLTDVVIVPVLWGMTSRTSPIIITYAVMDFGVIIEAR